MMHATDVYFFKLTDYQTIQVWFCPFTPISAKVYGQIIAEFNAE